jgi:hypothetical protein
LSEIESGSERERKRERGRERERDSCILPGGRPLRERVRERE